MVSAVIPEQPAVCRLWGGLHRASPHTRPVGEEALHPRRLPHQRAAPPLAQRGLACAVRPGRGQPERPPAALQGAGHTVVVPRGRRLRIAGFSDARVLELAYGRVLEGDIMRDEDD